MSNEDLTNMNVVLYALYVLSRTRKKVFTEDIALKSFKLDPSRFSWRRYPDYPDIEPVRRILIFARDENRLVTGRSGEVKGLKPSDGWIFSPEGILWIEKNKSKIARALGDNPKPVDRTDLSWKLNELEKSSAYKKFLRDGGCTDIKPYEFTDFLSASLDTPPPILRDRIDKLSALAATGKRQKLLDFIAQCEKHFLGLLNM